MASCVISDRAVRFDKDGVAQPLAGKVVRCHPAASPTFVSGIEELDGVQRYVETDAAGDWSFTLEYTALDPTNRNYELHLVNGERWRGPVPHVPGPLTIKQLRDTYGWTSDTTDPDVGVGYDQAQSAGTAVTQRKVFNVDGTLLVAADDSVNGRTNITAPGLVPKTTTITAGAGLAGGGDLSASRTLSMPNVGPGAGTIGGGGNVIASITLDAQGRVTAATAGAGGGGTPTLQQVYAASSSGIVGLTSTPGGLVLKDASTPIAAPLLGISNNAGSITSYWEFSGGATRWRSGGANLHILFDQPATAGTPGRALFVFGGKGANASGSTAGANGGAAGAFAGNGGDGTATLAAGSGVALSLTGGDAGVDAGGGGGNGGNVYIGGGAPSGSGTAGMIRFAVANVDRYRITGDVFEAQSIPLGMRSTVADGAGAVAAFVDTTTAWSNAGAKLLSLRNNAVEKAAFKQDGSLAMAAGATLAVGANTLVSGDLLQVSKLSHGGATNGQVVTLVSGTPAWADAAGGTLQASYDAGDGQIVVRGSHGSQIQIAVNMIDDPISGPIFSVDRDDSGVITNLFIIDTVNSAILRSSVADGASAVGVILDSFNPLTGGSAKLISIRNGNAEKASISPNGSLTIATGATITAGSTTLVSGDALQAAHLAIASQAAGDILYASSTTAWARRAKGTDGQVLTLASGVPTWADAAGGSSSIGGSAGAPSPALASGSTTGFYDAGSNVIGVAFSGTVGVFMKRLSSSEVALQAPSGGYVYGESNNELNYWRVTNGEMLIVGGNGAAGIKLDSNGNTITSDMRCAADGGGDLGTSGHAWRDFMLNGGVYQKTTTAPATPPASYTVRYIKDNGSGKQQYAVKWAGGAETIIATEP